MTTPKSNTPTLKPCPFCGEAPNLIDCGNYNPAEGPVFECWGVFCEECGIEMLGTDERIKEQAVEAWNTRADDNDPQENGR